MCSLYYLDEADLPREIGAVIEGINRRKPRRYADHDIAPTDIAPVITARGAAAMQWGFTMPGSRVPIINARSETAAQRPMFAPSLQQRRCLLPASGYYEWDKRKNKYVIGRGRLMYMAGIYRPEDDRTLRFCILTRPPVTLLADIHDRMPVILEEEAAEQWLRGRLNPAEAGMQAPKDLTAHTDAVQLSLFD